MLKAPTLVCVVRPADLQILDGNIKMWAGQGHDYDVLQLCYTCPLPAKIENLKKENRFLDLPKFKIKFFFYFFGQK